MKKVIMKKTVEGVNEGKVYPETFEAGKEYIIGDSLFKSLDSIGAVEIAKEKAVLTVEERQEKTRKRRSKKTNVGGE